MREVEQYRELELSFPAAGPADIPRGVFRRGERTVEVEGFFAGGDTGRIRFLADEEGLWTYEGKNGGGSEKGAFLCVKGQKESRGVVRTSGTAFADAAGRRFLPFGTTCYAWIYQPGEIRKQTLRSLAESPFNKVRMCLFPKDMIYNEEEPPFFPYRRGEDGRWNIGDPDPDFWEALEDGIRGLGDLGIEADLILFHPYDRWGFSTMTKEENLAHIRYCVARLAAFPNVWWSLANEYDLMPGWTAEDWDACGREVSRLDPWHHLISIHNCFEIFGRRDWMTHCSIQTGETKRALEFQKQYDLPVVIDECGYEGDIPFDWGNLSAFELVHRIWMGCMRGAFCTHGETYWNKENRLWWSKGGTLRGESVCRIAFLRRLLEALPEDLAPFVWQVDVDPNGKKQEGADTPFARAMMRLAPEERTRRIYEMIPMVLQNGDCRLQYLGRSCQKTLDVAAPGEGEFTAEIIDVWEMSVRRAVEKFSGSIRLELPGREGTAVLIRRRAEESAEHRKEGKS